MRARQMLAVLVAGAILVLGLATTGAAAPASSTDWFAADRSEPAAASARPEVAPDDTVTRTRFVGFDAPRAVSTLIAPAAWKAARAGQRIVVTPAATEIVIELFDGRTLRVEPLEVAVRLPPDDPDATPTLEWLGVARTDGAISAQVSLAFTPAGKGGYVAAGSVMTRGGQVLISRTSGDTYQLDKLTETSDLPQGSDFGTGDTATSDIAAEEPSPPAPAGAPAESGAAAAAAAVTANVDVIVAYGNGNPSDIVSRIGAKVAEANNALATSGVKARLNLIATPSVNYTQHATNMFVDRDSLANGTGNLSALHTQRDQLGADLVGLVVPNSTNACGVANGIPAAGGNANLAWQVSANACFDVDRHVLVHEFGHLLGGRHNPEQDSTESPYPYSHGQQTNGVARTIMAYDVGCTLTCPMTLQFSNPDMDYIGFPTVKSGDPGQRNNTLSLNNLAPFIAAYRVSGSLVLLRGTATPGSAQASFLYGISAYKHLLCDFDGDGVDGIVAFGDNGNWYIRSTATAGPPQQTVAFGATGYIPVCGDWDGVGGDGIGVYVNGTWYLRQTASAGPAQVTFAYGTTGYTPVVGDWDGHVPFTHGRDGIGVYFGAGNWALRQTASAGPAEISFAHGTSAYLPVVGDWDNDVLDRDGVGAWGENGMWFLRQTASAGASDVAYAFGNTGLRPLPGDHDGDGIDGSGVVVP